MFTTLGKALVDDGHEVWMLASDKFDKNIKERGIIPLTFPLNPENDHIKQWDELAAENPEGTDIWNKWLADPWLRDSVGRTCDSVMQNRHINRTIHEQKFDLVVHDGAPEIYCVLMIPYTFGIPFMTVQGAQITSWVSGVTGMPSIEPEMFSTIHVSNRMNFWERMENLKSWLETVNNYFYDQYDDRMQKYCPKDKPKIPLKKVSEMAEMYLMAFEIMCLDYPRVSAPNMQYIGGITALPAEPLQQDLQAFVAGAEHGAILMSFGSKQGAQNIWRLIGEKIFEAFARLPQRVIVLYKLDTVYGKVSGNVKLMTWLPQNDILGHRNIKLFITHGGNNGTHVGYSIFFRPKVQCQAHRGTWLWKICL
jgi:UDP:flavonoid glycosyltransferase YjiC (YdhE family)